jgi:hypothetical protein
MLAVGCVGPEELIENPDVDVWCGDTPCGWQVDGRIERVGTWHSHDYAVSFESDDARLHQANPDADESISCISFSMIAKVSAGTKAFVELDFLDDGKVDWSEQIPAADFEHFSFYVTPPPWFEGVRFIVRKEGPGQMVLAKLRALDDVTDYDQCTADAVELDELPTFARCAQGDECRSGRCLDGFCAGCTTDDDCEDSVCGYAELPDRYGEYSLNDVVPACIEEGSRSIGSRCLGDAECENGTCSDCGICSDYEETCD